MTADLDLVREAVRDEAVKRGIHDPEMVGLLDLSKVAVEDGTAKAADVEAIVASLRRSKPALFKQSDASKLNDENFQKLTEELRSRVTLQPGGPRLDGLKLIDAAQLDVHEMQALNGVLTGVGTWHDRSVVEAAARRQNITLKLGAAD